MPRFIANQSAMPNKFGYLSSLIFILLKQNNVYYHQIDQAFLLLVQSRFFYPLLSFEITNLSKISRSSVS
jgi:hypothetical protein